MNTIMTKFLAVGAVAIAASTLAATGVQAQQVYRIVGPDGKVTFSDQPPPPSTNTKVTSGTENSGRSGSGASTSLPFELRQIAARYPVTLYTGANCGPCSSARAMLTSRGVPFTEKTISSNDDIQALQRMSGETSLPFATVGGQQLKGFSDIEWTQFLNAAGYPATSLLPANYQQPPATPLVTATAAASPAQNAPATPPRTQQAVTPSAPPPSVSNPAGIRF